VQRADRQRIALCRFDGGGIDFDEFALALLKAALTTLAHRNGDLIARTPFVTRALQHLAREQ
jgi:hypothetical protein